MNKFSLKPMLVALTLLSPVALVHAAEHSTPVKETGSAEQRREVLQAVEQWKQAVIKKDRAGLERAYHADLSYGHTDGAVLTKQEQIDRTIVPNRDFTDVDLTDIAVRVYGNTAFVTGGFAFHVAEQGSEPRVARLAGLDVWTKGPQGWQLVARQLTRLP
ncbi:nuclear transport factor 2 family protein [Peristeroidobacter soli]|uniref:nuclear transport factor 2 family protein n=1 Tax=Peristeroidobacter soli TaxID=2497877 RepID=UPI001C37E02C|nr:nuclear transport factor 2 family protein [Peristeroidobacter soli]